MHTDIVKLEEDIEGNKTDNLYEYNEIQYTKDEYIELLAQQVTETQIALIELFESKEV